MAKKKSGRPSRYDTEIKDKLPAVQGWAMHGFTKAQIADKLGIHISTLCEYQNKYSEFAEALKKGKEVADYEVVNSLHENATGYWRKEQVVSSKKTVGYNKEGKRIEVTEPVVVEVDRWYPANVTAQIYWTKNRMPKEWSDKKDAGAQLDGAGSITFNIMPASQRPQEDESEE